MSDLRLVIACGRRILRALDGSAWDEPTREAVLAALLERSDGDREIERALAGAKPEWTNRAAFERWVERAAMEDES